MPKRSAAAKKFEPEFEDGKCTTCGHDFDQHMGPGATTHGPFTCPALPPAKTKQFVSPFVVRASGITLPVFYDDRQAAVDGAKLLGYRSFEVADAHGRVCDTVGPLWKPKQATVDEAVVAKGGKPVSDFAAQVEAASGEAERKDRLKVAEEHFERPRGAPMTLDVALSQLRPMANNPRGEVGDVSGLAKVMEAGFIGTLVVREIGAKGDEPIYEVIIGNRRLKAAKEAGLKSVPCDVYELNDVQALEMNLSEQTNREPLEALQEGDACRRLVELAGYDAHQVAEKFGKSASWVTKRIQLAGIAPELRKAVTKGGLSVTLANALASLPTHAQQLKAHTELEARPEWDRRSATAETDAEWIRENVCLPLADATWKVTDAELVPEVGACSTCPKNSANDRAPGLFDTVKSKPMCLDRACFEDKALAAWLLRTAKHKAAGAKVLSLSECRKLFARGNDLGSASRYVEAIDKPLKDKQGRTVAEMVADVPEEHRPQLHVAQDNGGKLRQLYVQDKFLEAAAVHLKARWAKSVVEEAQERSDPATKVKREEAEKEARLIAEVRRHVEVAVINGVASVLSRDGLTLPAARLMADRLGERAVAAFAEATGRKKLPKDWLQKGATMNELLALVWLDDALDQLGGYDRYTDEFLALAKSAGANVEAMTAAQLATAKQEAAKGGA